MNTPETAQASPPFPAADHGAAMAQLVEVVQQLSLARDLATVMDIVRRAARGLTGADGATFVLRDGDLCFYAEEDAISPLWKGQRFPMSLCISGWVMLNRQPAVIEDIYADPRIPADAYRPTFVRSLAMVPIRTLDPVGAIGNYWARPHRPHPEQVRMLQALADTTAVAMENVRVYAELEQRVRERTTELETILDNVQIGVVFVTGGRIVRANPRSADLFGHPGPAALLGMPIGELLRAAGHDASLTEQAAADLSRGEVFDAEKRLERGNQPAFWAHLVCQPIEPAVYPDSAIWMIDDISAAKEKENLLVQMKLAAEESARFKSEFLASMSHELRTPLNAIIGFSEILRDGIVGRLDDRQHEYLCDIFDSGQHLLSLVNDVLDLSKVEAGKMVAEAEMTDIGQLLAGCLSIVREKSMAHRIRLRIDAPDAMGACWLDQRKVRQIVYNLLSNAVKFTPEDGEVTLHASLASHEEALRRPDDRPEMRTPLPQGSDRFLQISVSDTGIGIAAEDMKRLFQPFVQIDSSFARRYQGTGLGLALVRRLAELLGGAVAVASMPGRGSRFTVWLPYHATPAEAESHASAAAPEAMAPEAGGCPRVLVVEDNDKAADLIRLQLETDHCQVMRAATAEAALAMLGEQPLPDLISLDILLPGMDGWDFLARIKQDQRLAHIPVVILSIVADCSKGLSLGASEVLQKPVGMDELAGALARLGFGLPATPGKTKTVLVIDDDPNAVEIVCSHLQQAHFNMLRAYGGAQGIAMAQSRTPDLIILDLMMPGVSGFEVVETLKTSKKTAQIPIIILTAKMLTAEDRALLNSHVLQVMQKSAFNHGKFISEVRRALSHRLEFPAASAR
jgi:PAS domain S-box-containing protein